jgi:hypothetical protein
MPQNSTIDNVYLFPDKPAPYILILDGIISHDTILQLYTSICLIFDRPFVNSAMLEASHNLLLIPSTLSIPRDRASDKCIAT